MSNHYHLVVRINDEATECWNDAEVVRRWSSVYRLPTAYIAATASEDKPAGAALRRELLNTWRRRLGDLGWFMRSINEPLARMANKEDECTGRFWEGRFRSQALLDEAAVIKCMAYVDLNPIRAGLARVPEFSEYTSIRARMAGFGQCLGGFADSAPSASIPVSYKDYLDFVSYSATLLRSNRRFSTFSDTPVIFLRLRLKPSKWQRSLENRRLFRRIALGSRARIERYRQHLRCFARSAERLV